MSTVYIRFSPPRSAAPQRSALLERLLARGRPGSCTTDWRAEALHTIAPEAGAPPPIAATAIRALGGAVGVWGCVATPIHFVAGMSAVSMPPDGRLRLSADDAAALAADFNRVFGAEARLVVGRAAVLLCVFDRAFEVVTHDPDTMAGRDVFAFQAAGPDAAPLRRLMSEMEMWLFDHDLNRARAARALRPISGLWLWGGGRLDSAPPNVRGWTAGKDPFFAAFGDQAQFPPAAGAGVVVCDDHPGSCTWVGVERDWLEPAVSALRARRIQRIELSCGARRWRVDTVRNWRVWRRPRPWWEYFDE